MCVCVCVCLCIVYKGVVKRGRLMKWIFFRLKNDNNDARDVRNESSMSTDPMDGVPSYRLYQAADVDVNVVSNGGLRSR